MVTFYMGHRVLNPHCNGEIRGGGEGDNQGVAGDRSVTSPACSLVPAVCCDMQSSHSTRTASAHPLETGFHWVGCYNDSTTPEPQFSFSEVYSSFLNSQDSQKSLRIPFVLTAPGPGFPAELSFNLPGLLGDQVTCTQGAKMPSMYSSDVRHVLGISIPCEQGEMGRL